MEIRDNLTARIAEATANGWGGDVDGLTLSRTAAEHQLDQMDQIAAHRGAAVHLGMPAFSDVAGQTVTTPRPARRTYAHDPPAHASTYSPEWSEKIRRTRCGWPS
jgi:hypothetical protein